MPSPPRSSGMGGLEGKDFAAAKNGTTAPFSLGEPAFSKPATAAFGGTNVFGVGAGKFAWGLEAEEEEKENLAAPKSTTAATCIGTGSTASTSSVTLTFGSKSLCSVVTKGAPVAHKRPRGDDAEEDDDAASTGAAGGSDDEDDDECNSEGQSRAKRGRRSCLRATSEARSEHERGARRIMFADDVKTHDGLCRVHHIFDKLIWDHFAKGLFRTAPEVVEAVGDDVKLYPELLGLFDGLADRIACSSVERAVLPGGGGSAAKLSPLHLSALLRLRGMVAEVGSDALGLDLTATSHAFEGTESELECASAEMPGSDDESTDDDVERSAGAGAGAGAAAGGAGAATEDCTAGDVAAICGLLSIADSSKEESYAESAACRGCGSVGCACLCASSPVSDGSIEVDVVAPEADVYSVLHSRTLTNDADIDVLGA